ncbi:hypothetical protein PaG_01118 [Moesziomyces aphidis]|uniref:Uncharacterized protein n=1 Tax=Moesziomyces aphidis TaxID=84754 RepID=W3VRW5_MOEAP|nr:hypothetical protein PaG_01118 [Moesziomyces aphidis]
MQPKMADEKHALLPEVATQPSARDGGGGLSWKAKLAFAALGALGWCQLDAALQQGRIVKHGHRHHSDWGSFPHKDDPFHFLPCTNATVPPGLDEAHPLEAWARLYDPNPNHWSRGNSSQSLYLCGWLDVPLDYTNASDDRIARLAVTKLQHAPKRSKRTMVVEPGGPGGSGTSLVWRKAEQFARKYTDDTFDVLGWDPRGVNVSQPSISCFPYDADRDRWSLLTTRFHREVDPRDAMLKADAMNQAIFEACKRKYGDVAGMLTTAFVARDLDEIRKALAEDRLNGYFISYGTGIGQTYVNMFPHAVGRLMLDGTEYVRDQRRIGGFGWAALDNITAAFQDGLLGECVDAGPDRCKLAQSLPGSSSLPTRSDLITAMDGLFGRLVERPLAGHTEASGPMIISYTQLISLIYGALYNPFGWDALAAGLHELLQGNTSMIAQMLDSWEYNPSMPVAKHSSDELGMLVICSDQYDSPLPPGYDVETNGERWYLELWKHMVEQSEIGGNGRFLDILPCRQWNATFGAPKEVYRGDLDHDLSAPVLLIAEAYDPATPLRNGRRLLREMGKNARLIAHHGYGHSSRDTSTCTDTIMRNYMLHGTLPDQQETQCHADGQPYRYTDAKSSAQLLHEWKISMAETQLLRGSSPRRRRV